MRSFRVLYLLTSQASSVLVRGQLRALADQGFEVTVGSRLDNNSTSHRFDSGVTTVNIPFARAPNVVADLRSIWAILVLILKVRPDIVNASTPKAGLLGMVVARVCRVPVRIYVVRGIRFETAAGWRRGLLRWLEKLAVRCATNVVYNSPSLQLLAQAEGVVKPQESIVFGSGSGNGVSVDRFSKLLDKQSARTKLSIALDADVVGFVGRLTADKGVNDLVTAIRAVFDERPSLRLLIVGDYETGDAVSPRAKLEIANDARIIHLPWLEDPAIAYCAMDVLAFPSYREGLPNVPIEAQLCERPVVAYRATGTVDSLIDGVTGVLVPTGDINQLREAIMELLDDEMRRTAMGKYGSAWVRTTFDQQMLWAEIITHYRTWLASADR